MSVLRLRCCSYFHARTFQPTHLQAGLSFTLPVYSRQPSLRTQSSPSQPAVYLKMAALGGGLRDDLMDYGDNPGG